MLGGMPGTVVRRDATVVIYNLMHKEPRIYFNRRLGGDIGWNVSSRAGAGKIRDRQQDAQKFRAATRALLMPGVILGDLTTEGRKRLARSLADWPTGRIKRVPKWWDPFFVCPAYSLYAGVYSSAGLCPPLREATLGGLSMDPATHRDRSGDYSDRKKL